MKMISEGLTTGCCSLNFRVQRSWWGGAATGMSGCWWWQCRLGSKGGDQLPGERPLRDGARDKCSPRPPFTGIISTLLICCSIHIHTRLRWMERERGRKERGRGAGESTEETCSQTNQHLRKKTCCSRLTLRFSLPPPIQGVFELLSKNSGLCIKLQFGKTKLSGGIIIPISKKKIKPLQIFLDYSAPGDLFPHPIFFIKHNCGNFPNSASNRHMKTPNNTSSVIHFKLLC